MKQRLNRETIDAIFNRNIRAVFSKRKRADDDRNGYRLLREKALRVLWKHVRRRSCSCSAERPKRNDKENGPILLTFLQEKPDAHHRLKQRNHMKMKT